MPELAKTVLQLDNIVKTFPGVRALNGVELTIRQGEVHAVCGENGAGKSTLMKIIAGAQPYTSGKMLVHGQNVVFHSTKDAEKHGIAMVYQEFNMVPELSIAENMYLGRLPKNKLGKVDWKKLQAEATDNLQHLGLKFDVKQKVKNISVAEAQMVEIAKCLTIGAEIIIMDEPTAALAESETKMLFKMIDELKSKHISVIYISHRMDEIFEVADRITVFRDGRYIDTKEVDSTNYDEIVSLMVGRDVKNLYPERHYQLSDVIMTVKEMTGQGVEDVSFELHRGEILGITGLLGSGTIELAKMLYGAIPKEKGEIIINGQVTNCSTPIKALRAGIGFVSDDRKQEGLVLIRSIKENASLSSLKNLQKGVRLNKKKEKERVNRQIENLNIKLSSMEQLVGKLSGGNQQKVVLAKVLEADPQILILAEPTRGVDVGAKAEIYQIMNQLADQGKSIIVISTDLPELIGVSDRIIIMREGKVVLETGYQEVNQELILANASGGVENNEK